MVKPSAPAVIRLRGVRHNNLKNFDLDLPQNRLIVITGLSGSGKSSLAFDTLFAEGQRRYIETFSPYARQFFDRMDKPQVDSIEGIPPAIAIEQRNSVKSTRSTVGTMTEICDYMKLLWPQIARLHCRQCGQPVRKDSPQQIWQALAAGANPGEVLITFAVPISEKLSLDESLALIARQGYQRLLVDDEVLRLEEAAPKLRELKPGTLTIVQDRLKPAPAQRARFVEACEQAYHFGKGKLAILFPLVPRGERLPRAAKLGAPPVNDARLNSLSSIPNGGEGEIPGRAAEWSPVSPRLFSNRLHCAACDLEYREPSPALFSFNHPLGACPACRGFGRIITIDYLLALPDRSKTLAGGVVKPWQTGQSAECQDDLMKFCRIRKAPVDVPFRELPQKWQDWVINGDPGYGKDEQHKWPKAWYGIKGYFRWLESKAYKMHVRVLLSRYRSYALCPTCHGQRFQPETLLYRIDYQPPNQPSDEYAAKEKENLENIPNPSSPSLPSRRARAPSRQVRMEERAGERRLSLSDFYLLTIRDAFTFIDQLAAAKKLKPNDPLALVVSEVRNRLGFLNEVGLGYLTLDRPTRSLSGGETERVNLTTCLGSRLVNTLFVLDEPSVGLHARDTSRLIRILEQLREAGNTVVVVEHEASVMRAADQIIDLGPGHGAAGGEVVFQGTCSEILRSKASLAGQYLAHTRRIEAPLRRPVLFVVPPLGGSGVTPDNAKESPRHPEFVVPPSGGPQNAPTPTFSIPQTTLHDTKAASPGEPPKGGTPCAPGTPTPTLTLTHATLHNLKDLTVQIPLARLVCLTGVSGSGKTTLAREVLLPLLTAKLNLSDSKPPGAKSDADDENDSSSDSDSDSEAITSRSITPNPPGLIGWEALGRVVLVDQSILGKTPRSNPAVYIGAFEDLREVFAQSELARQRGLNASAFSFNSVQGQCERCRGAGFEKIEMQFLSDIFIRCPDCNGRRYRPHILEIKISPSQDGARLSRPQQFAAPSATGSVKRSRKIKLAAAGTAALRAQSVNPQSSTLHPPFQPQSIADLLDSPVDEAIAFLSAFPDSRPAARAVESLKLLQEVGLGYLRLGQPINTLSGGESQRLKLVRHLAEFAHASAVDTKPTLFVFDEPTTGLHFDDVRVLLQVFQRLVTAGHSVLIIEHNLDVIKCADWVIDLGPEAGDRGGEIVAQGTPDDIAACADSHTGVALNAARAIA